PHRGATGRSRAPGSAPGPARAPAQPTIPRERGDEAQPGPWRTSLRRPKPRLVTVCYVSSTRAKAQSEPERERASVACNRLLLEMGRIRLGLLSTADINGAILGARADDAPFDVVAVGSRDGARAQAY